MRILMKGNEAMAEAAVRAGLELYVGYPITPQSEMVEYLSARMPELGRSFIQSESEVISINAAMGGAMTGAKVMTSSSGVGISLMQEGITAAFGKRAPLVLINVNRCGWGMGGGKNVFAGGQGDYLRDTRGGGNGDYRIPVFCPCDLQEAVDLVYGAFDIALRYRTPVEIMTEGRLGQMMEDIELPEMKEVAPRPEWGLTGERRGIDFNNVPAFVQVESMKQIEENEQRWELYRCDDAEIVIVSLGIISRVCHGAIDAMREKGIKVGMLRVISCWPFPVEGFEALPESVKAFATVEMNVRGEMIEDVKITCKDLIRYNSTPIFEWHEDDLPDESVICDFIEDINNKL